MKFYRASDRYSALQFSIFQAVTFLVSGYYVLSLDFSVMGLLPSEAFLHETREPLYRLWKTPAYAYLSGIFVYRYLPTLSVSVIAGLQYLTGFFSLLGLFGILPRLSAFVSFGVLLHLCSLYLMANNTLDASTTVLLLALFILCLAPTKSLYQFKKGKFCTGVGGGTWLYAFWFAFAFYYFVSGLNKVLDIGWNWPLLLRLDFFSEVAIEKSIFQNSWITHLALSKVLLSTRLSFAIGLVTLLAELAAPMILVRGKARNLIIVYFAVMHVMIYLSHGYGYLSYSLFDLLLLDFVTFQRARV